MPKTVLVFFIKFFKCIFLDRLFGFFFSYDMKSWRYFSFSDTYERLFNFWANQRTYWFFMFSLKRIFGIDELTCIDCNMFIFLFLYSILKCQENKLTKRRHFKKYTFNENNYIPKNKKNSLSTKWFSLNFSVSHNTFKEGLTIWTWPGIVKFNWNDKSSIQNDFITNYHSPLCSVSIGIHIYHHRSPSPLTCMKPFIFYTYL